MDGRTYTVDLTPTAVTATTVDLIELGAADDIPIEVISTNINQTSDAGDAQAEVEGLIWVRGNTTSGSGGNTVTPRPVDPADAAASFTAESFNSTAASSGTALNLNRVGWNVQLPVERPFVPGEKPRTNQGAGFLCLRLVNAPADSITISGSIIVREM